MYKRTVHKLFCKRKNLRIKSNFVFKQSQVNDILYNTSLFTVLSDHINLRERGKNGNYTGKCPICNNLTTNRYQFRYSKIKNVYKCFNCGISGKLPTMFICQRYKVSFQEAIFYLKRKYHKNKKLEIERIVVSKYKNNIGEDDLPF